MIDLGSLNGRQNWNEDLLTGWCSLCHRQDIRIEDKLWWYAQQQMAEDTKQSYKQ